MPQPGAIRAGRAYVELYADNSKLVRGLRAASGKLQAFGASIRTMGLRIMGVGTALITPLVAASKTFASMGDAMAKMARRTGVSVEALSELGFVAELAGADAETLELGLRRMQATIYDAARGLSTAKDVLKLLSLTVRDFVGLTPDEQFKLLADRISQLDDPTLKAAAAMQLFGRSGTRLLPMLDLGAKEMQAFQEYARKLGITITAEDALAAERLKDALATLWKVMGVGVRQVGAALASNLTDLAKRMTTIIARAARWIRQNGAIIVTVAKIAVGIVAAGGALVVLGTALSAAGALLGTFAGILGALLSPIGLVTASIVALGATCISAFGAGGKALDWLRDRFWILKGEATQAWTGIANALKSGDIGLAAEVFWAYLQLEWTRGSNALKKIWAEAWTAVLKAAETAWTGILRGQVQVNNFLQQAWSEWMFARKELELEHAMTLYRIWAWLRSKFDDTFDYNEAMREARQVHIALWTAANARNVKETDLLEELTAARLEAERDIHTATMQLIGDDEAARLAAIQKVADAQEKLNALTTKAAAKAAETVTDDTALEDYLAKLQGRVSNLSETFAEQIDKISVRGTFLAANVLGLQAGGVTAQNRMAAGIEKIERNTRPLRDLDEAIFTD